MTTPQQQVLSTAKRMLERGLVSGTAGNVSTRVDDERVAISPSSVPYETMEVDDVVVVDYDGNLLEGENRPSSEFALHTSVYKEHAEINAVIHTHPLYASMYAVTRQPIPAVIDEFAIYVGGDVPVCDYAPSGTPELAENVAKQVDDVAAALLANHGLVSVGPSLDKALHVAHLVERAAQITWGARTLGTIQPLPEEVNRNFAGIYQWLRNNA